MACESTKGISLFSFVVVLECSHCSHHLRPYLVLTGRFLEFAGAPGTSPTTSCGVCKEELVPVKAVFALE